MKKKSNSRLIEIIIALLVGFGFYYYIYDVIGFVNFNPHVVFFLTILAMFVVSLVIKKTYFISLLSFSAIVFWILDKTPLLEELEKWKWILSI